MRSRQGRRPFTARKEDKTRINENIHAPELRVIDEDGEQLGIMTRERAIEISSERQLDLVEVAPDAEPPVCRIMNYGKYKFEMEKRARQARRHQKVVEVKEIRLKPNMAEHDIAYRVRHAEEFLSEGNKVRATVRFFGRQIIHTELGHELLMRFADKLDDGVIEQPPKLEGRQMSVLLAPRVDTPGPA
jgi:translation initiation factor IF-3